MKTYLFGEKAHCYKANMHTHTTVSDGAFSPEETKRRYMEQGYSVVAFTDHEVLFDHSDLSDENFLAITSYEAEIMSGASENSDKLCHLNLYAKDPHNTTLVGFDSNRRALHKYQEDIRQGRIKYTGKDAKIAYSPAGINEFIKTAKENGFLVCYNHPAWSNETIFDFCQYDGFFAMEIYNHASYVSETCTAEEWNIKEYDMLLNMGKRIYPICADDSHNPDVNDKFCDGFGGFLIINAENLTYRAVLDAIEHGDFYASTGAMMDTVFVEDGKLCVTCPDAAGIKFFTNGRRGRYVKGESGQPVTYGEYQVHPDDGFVRVEVFSKDGKIACSRAYFMEELL